MKEGLHALRTNHVADCINPSDGEGLGPDLLNGCLSNFYERVTHAESLHERCGLPKQVYFSVVMYVITPFGVVLLVYPPEGGGPINRNTTTKNVYYRC